MWVGHGWEVAVVTTFINGQHKVSLQWWECSVTTAVVVDAGNYTCDKIVWN